ncbi:hypothetical protein [Hymenobacter arizonensis]|uniref:Uncharacterized protein n=1 Tax=Hymenobacter arizonensis TaxID=1227077 RepID=A0A1I5UUC9_HYMAR|nr:hypothetical protein [Hymenobacter arizonensis]SFP98861.1 hypothetical protein SAMN04515668_1076 [Hymenobacter arizonensis]
MSKLNQFTASLPQPCAAKAGEKPNDSRRWVGRTAVPIVAWGLLALFLLPACSEDSPRRPDSEMVVDPPSTAADASATAPPREDVIENADQPTGPLTGAGRHYRVAVGTAYFFDSPQQSTPNGRYLRRGDEFYGEGETNGFVKTGFKAPNGAQSTGWLKAQELTRLGAGPATPAPVRKPSPVAAPPAPTPTTEASPAASEPTAAPVPANAQTAVVKVARSYFYNSPDLSLPRLAHCVRGDKVRLGESRGEAVYVTFTNWQKVTSTGWMRKDALDINP